jgi:hypothetical protein
MPQQFKRGRLGNPEMDYMREHVVKDGVDAVAKALNRDPHMVREWVRDNMAMEIQNGEVIPLEEVAIRKDFMTSPEWQELKDEFTESECAYFLHRYGKLINQFKGDVLPTEETQIFFLIKFEILLNRNLKSRQRALTDIERIQAELTKIYARQQLNEHDKERASNLEKQLVSTRETENNKTGEFVKLSEKHSAIMKELKATRDQRISKIENAKESFLGLIKALQEENYREHEGKGMEIMNLAMLKEKKRLGSNHKYADGTIDKPLLSVDTIGEAENVNYAE